MLNTSSGWPEENAAAAQKEQRAAEENAATAKEQQGIAEEETATAQRNARESRARELTGYAREILSDNPERSIMWPCTLFTQRSSTASHHCP